MSPLKFHIIADQEKAKELWEVFSPHKTIDDEWDFREVFNKVFDFPFHFIVGYDDDKAVGLLPLQLNTGKGLDPKFLNIQGPFLEFFGGIDTDDNHVMLLPGYENYAIDFLKQIDKPSVLTDLNAPYSFDGSEALHYTDRFQLDLQGLATFEDFLKKDFSGKSRGTIMNKLNHIRKNYVVEIKDGTEEDLDLLFYYSIDKFGDNSSFTMEYRKQIYRDLLSLYPIDIFTILLNGEKKAVAYCIVHNKIYTLLNVGYDHELRDIGKLMVAEQINRAINHNCTVYDAGKGDNGWKERYHLTKIPQYKLSLNTAENK